MEGDKGHETTESQLNNRVNTPDDHDVDLSDDDRHDTGRDNSRAPNDPSASGVDLDDGKEREDSKSYDRHHDSQYDESDDDNDDQRRARVGRKREEGSKYDDSDDDDDFHRDRREDEDEKQPEDDHKDEEEFKDLEQAEFEPLLSKPVVYARTRSHCLTNGQRAVLESQYMHFPEKSELLKYMMKNTNDDTEDPNKPHLTDSDKEVFRKLEMDGVYRIGVAADNLVTETLTRPIDLSLRQIFRTKAKGSIASERMNSIKSKHYKLELIIGKLILRDHQYFSAEDVKAIEVTELHEEFERVAGLGMIPFYDNRIESLKDEIYKAEGAKKVDEDHIRFLKATLMDVRKKKAKEKNLIKDLGFKLYNSWVELRAIREKQDFESTSVHLTAHETPLPNGKKEIIFYLNHKTPLDKTIKQGKPIPSYEMSRRSKIRSLTAKVDVIVNGFKVETTKEAHVSWPGLEAEFGDQFVLFLYTMPKKIELKISINNHLICIVPVEVPGSKVEALTSTYAITKEVRFSRDGYKAELKAEADRQSGVDIKNQRLELKKLEEENKKMQQEHEKMVAGAVAQPNAQSQPQAHPNPVVQQNNAQAAKNAAAVPSQQLDPIKEFKKSKRDINGFLYFKGEWKGEGSTMPPLIDIEQEIKKERKIEKITQMRKTKLIDINDPRFESVVKGKKERNEHLKKLIEEDSLIPLHDIQPFRHIQLINQDTHYELNRIDIPLLESEVVNDPVLSMFIEKFSKLGAMQTYNKMLGEVKSLHNTERLQDMSEEVLERRQKFMEKIKRVQKDIKTGKSKPFINYNTVVDEVGGIEAQNPCVGIIEKIFAPRRKLRPIVKEKASVSLESVGEATIKVQIICGINIPIRTESLQAIEALNEQINGRKNQPQGVGRDAPQFGAGARVPQNLQNYPDDRREDAKYSPRRDDYDRSDYDNRQRDLDRSRGDYDRSRGDYDRSRGDYDRSRGDYDRSRGDLDRSRGDFDRSRGDYNRGRSEFDRPRDNRRGSPLDDRRGSPRDYNRSRSEYDRSRGDESRNDDRSRGDFDRSPDNRDRSDNRDRYDRDRFDDRRDYEGGASLSFDQSNSIQHDGGDISSSIENDGGDTPPRYDRGGRNFDNRPDFSRGGRTDFDRGNNLALPPNYGFDRPDSRGVRTQFDNSYNPRGIDNRFGATNYGSQLAPPGIGQNRNYPNYSGYGTVQNPYGNSFITRGIGGATSYGGGYNDNFYRTQGNIRGPDNLGAVGRAKLELTGIRKLIKGSTFIEVRYTSDRFEHEAPQIKRTRECTGSFPDWNETLSFRLFAKNGKSLSEDEIVKGNDTLYFSIFDKYETERRIPNSNKHEITVENKFLGSFSVKLISILQNSPKMEGHIRVDRPMSLQGYGMLPSGMLSSNIFNKEIDTDLIPTYVSLSINIDPLLELPAENEYDYYTGGEVSRLLRAGALWANTHRKIEKGIQKIVKVFGENVERKSILLSRFITKQAPPIELIDFEHGNQRQKEYAIQLAARFVSLIPFIEDNKAFEDMPDLWCTSQEFLDYNGGDYEEHAILLCNYFNYIDEKLNEGKIKSYIILGNAVPEGYTTYVLRRNTENSHVEIWDAIKGQAYFFGKKREKHTC